jgi:hypothetical protein
MMQLTPCLTSGLPVQAKKVHFVLDLNRRGIEFKPTAVLQVNVLLIYLIFNVGCVPNYGLSDR